MPVVVVEAWPDVADGLIVCQTGMAGIVELLSGRHTDATPHLFPLNRTVTVVRTKIKILNWAKLNS